MKLEMQTVFISNLSNFFKEIPINEEEVVDAASQAKGDVSNVGQEEDEQNEVIEVGEVSEVINDLKVNVQKQCKITSFFMKK